MSNLEKQETQFLAELKEIVSLARHLVSAAVNVAQVQQNWLIGQRIVEQGQNGKARAEYGKHVIELASASLAAEFGKGFSFVACQQLVRTETADFYIDLVFYNYILKCFVIVELKTHAITHQDIGQLDMYVRMYDELKKGNGDNSSIEILLCTETDKTLAHYSMLNENKQKCKTYL